MKFGVIVFPASNCDLDAYHALQDMMRVEVDYIWHEEKEIEQYDCIIIPGGFSYGDYLRCGAVAQFSKVMEEVKKHAEKGKLVIGICNGFQILTEAGLLPGALVRNKNLKFICDVAPLRVVNNHTAFTHQLAEGDVIDIPVAHGEGNYVVEDDVLKAMRKNGQIVFTYENNKNGSTADIAGIINEEGNVLGMMPHPERACDPILGNTQGRKVFESIIETLKEGR